MSGWRVVGCALLAVPVVGFFVLIARDVGVGVATRIFGASIGVTLVVVVGALMVGGVIGG